MDKRVIQGRPSGDNEADEAKDFIEFDFDIIRVIRHGCTRRRQNHQNSAPALRALDPEHVELAEQIGGGDGAIAGHGL